MAKLVGKGNRDTRRYFLRKPLLHFPIGVRWRPFLLQSLTQ